MPEAEKTWTGSYSISLMREAEDEVRKPEGLVENLGAEWERRREETKWPPPSSEGITTAAMALRDENR